MDVNIYQKVYAKTEEFVIKPGALDQPSLKRVLPLVTDSLRGATLRGSLFLPLAAQVKHAEIFFERYVPHLVHWIRSPDLFSDITCLLLVVVL